MELDFGPGGPDPSGLQHLAENMLHELWCWAELGRGGRWDRESSSSLLTQV